MLTASEFIAKWKSSGGHERGSGQLFLIEFCELLGIPRPDAPQPETAQNDYVFERAIPRTKKDGSQTTVFLDLYKAGHLVLETKQGVNPARNKNDPTQSLLKGLAQVPSPKAASGHGTRETKAWDKALERAYEQARRYIRDLPSEEDIPPFLIVCDVGYVFELYADFSGTRGTYTPFPVAGQHRIFLDDLADESKRQLLHTVFTDPHSLDPSKHAAMVTREVSTALARLATSLEKQKHDPQIIALFLQRCLFTLFAEDIGLLPAKSFEDLLGRLKNNHRAFTQFITTLWKEMATGTDFSTVIRGESIVKIPHFNGGLFENPSALPLDGEQITLLLHAATKDWSEVEPAIFGTLLERALDPRDRHKLGAHYTPRSYVERLVQPTLLQPLREQWDAAKTAAALHHAEFVIAEDKADQLRAASSEAVSSGEKKKADALAKKIAAADKKARIERLAAVKPLTDFHHQLCDTKVLDPACGSGNFLYVAMARMKELEAEVLDLLAEIAPNETLTAEMDKFKVRPDQFLGLEINERATAIAQLVIWIGYFQWHKKTTGKADTNDRPLLPKQSTIECRDAVLDYDDKVPLKDEDGAFITIWDGHTTKAHPVTGKEVPDDTARKPLFEYINPRRTTWPETDYIVGNPPFLGNKRMRDGLGDGYTEALRHAFRKHKPDSWDFVMFWWHHAAELVRDRKVQQFGFITTNSISQTYGQKCTTPFIFSRSAPISFTTVYPDHPWVDSTDGAAVRISMTVLRKGSSSGYLLQTVSEQQSEHGEVTVSVSKASGSISPNLTIQKTAAPPIKLAANASLAFMGVKMVGQGFVLDANQKRDFKDPDVIRPIVSGRDINQTRRNLFGIDLFGKPEEQVKLNYPEIYQHLSNSVKPKRAHDKRKSYRDAWWQFAEPRSRYRKSKEGLTKVFLTSEVSKHRFFVVEDSTVIPDGSVIAIAVSDPLFLGIISSLPHQLFTLFTCGVLENRPRYQSSRCFETFPFPDLPEGALKARIRDQSERLDAHRKARQAEHPDLTLTGIYNVLEKLRKEEPLTDKDKVIHEHGLITLLKQLHDDLDDAVLEAYGWQYLQTSIPLADRLARGDEDIEQAILQRLVDLNHERAAEEARGHIRYLRPEFQDPDYGKEIAKKQQDKLGLPEEKSDAPGNAILPIEKLPWPKSTVERVAILKTLLQTLSPDPTQLSPALKGNNTPKRREEIQDLIDTLASLGQL